MRMPKLCAISQFPGTLSIIQALLLGEGRSCTYDIPDTGSLDRHEAPRVFSCHISVAADIWIFIPARPAPAQGCRAGPAV